MRPQQYTSQQVWLFPSRVAWSAPEALSAGFWGLSKDPFPYTAFIQTHAWVCRIWTFIFLQEYRRRRLSLFLFLLLYEHCANKTWFLGYFCVITLQTFYSEWNKYSHVPQQFLSSSPDRPGHFHSITSTWITLALHSMEHWFQAPHPLTCTSHAHYRIVSMEGNVMPIPYIQLLEHWY